jgi:hypothetical protein
MTDDQGNPKAQCSMTCVATLNRTLAFEAFLGHWDLVIGHFDPFTGSFST